MQRTATWNFTAADHNRLPELLKLFGCEDLVAPVEEDRFARRASEVICRKKAALAADYRLWALQCEEGAAATRDPYAEDMLSAAARKFVQVARQIEDGEL
jgi:hypothetical protein